MADIVIDKSLNVHLGLPEDYQLDKGEAFKLWQYFMSMLEDKRPIGNLLVSYYIDFHGDVVNNPKSKQDEIVRDIILNMDKKDQFEIMTEMAAYPDGYKVDNEE